MYNLKGVMILIRLFLTRHGQTQWNVERRFQGSKDSPLTEIGTRQAILLGERLANERIDTIYSSHLQRAYKTADFIRSNRAIEIIEDKNLSEMNFGDWEGLKHDELIEKFPSEYDAFWNAPHLYKSSSGENFEDFRKRVLLSLNDIINNHDGETVLIVTHTVVLKQIMSYFEDKHLEKLWDPPYMHPTSLTIVEIDKNEVRIKLHADTEHLGIDHE